jgi:hypothetical protein
VCATDPAGGTLAELGTQFSCELHLRHERTPRKLSSAISIKLSEGDAARST